MKKHYRKYCMHLVYAIISTSTFLFSSKTFSQEKLKITSEFSKQIIEKYEVEPFKIFPVTIKEIENKSIIYVMEENPIDLDLLSGDFIKLPDNYMLSNEGIPNRFVKNELFTYKTWKTKYLALLQSAQTNVNTCNAIIKKHTYLNRFGQKRYDSEKFTKQEKLTFNKNLDSLNEKLKKIGDLEDERNFLSYYNNKVSTVEATKSYSLSSFYNSTSRSY